MIDHKVNLKQGPIISKRSSKRGVHERIKHPNDEHLEVNQQEVSGKRSVILQDPNRMAERNLQEVSVSPKECLLTGEP